MAKIPPADTPITDKGTSRVSLEWYSAFQRIVSEIATFGSGGVASFEGRSGIVTAQAGDYTASEVTNVPAGNLAATDVQAALNELDAEKQPLDADLTALAGLSSTGLVAHTGVNTFTERTLTAPAAGITVSNGDGVAGNPTLALANDLAALEGLGSTGLAARTAANTWAQRTVTGTANEISVADGDGVAGNPTLSLPATIDLGGKTSLEIPNSAAPTVDANGEIAVDTTVTDFSHGIIKYFSGEECGAVAMPIAQFTSPTDGHVVTYDGTNDEFKLAAAGGASGGVVLLTSGTVSSAATLDIVLTSYTSYRAIKFVLQSFVPATDDVELWMRFSTNAGSSYDATGYNWLWTGLREGASGSPISDGSGSANQIPVAGRGGSASQAISNVAAEGGADVEITLFNQTATGRWPRATFNSGCTTADSQALFITGMGQRETAQDTDAVRFLMESGNIASGNYAVYGLL